MRQCLTAGGLTLLVGVGAVSVVDQHEPQSPAEPIGLSGQGIDAVLERHRCSVTGFGSQVVPAEAVVRFGTGEARVVSFERGWASFTGDKPGELVAVCLGKKQPRTDRANPPR